MKSIIDRDRLIAIFVSEFSNVLAADYPYLDFSSYTSGIMEAHHEGLDYLVEHCNCMLSTLASTAWSDIELQVGLIRLYQQTMAFAKKRSTSKNVPAALKKDAFQRHLANEAFNSKTNRRFASGKHNAFIKQVLVRARHYVHQELGPLGHYWDRIMSSLSFGSGSVYGDSERSLLSKVITDQTVAVNTAPLASEIIHHMPALARAWALGDVKLERVAGNKIGYVPKDVSKCRLIAVEPSINVLFQVGIGTVLAEICAGMGQPITDQERQRELALQASIDGLNATIDLSDASSMISIGLVRYLVPTDWFLLLDSARSKQYVTRKGQRKGTAWESFSSQGNGFTFPLETILFHSICRAAHEIYCERHRTSAGRRNIHAYGDDIIVPTTSAKAVIAALRGCGLKVNSEKSFFNDDAPCFRESCGIDAYGGYNVRPIFYKEDAHCPSDVAKLHNGLILKYPYLSETVAYLRSLVPNRLKGPYGLYQSNQENPERNGYFEPTFQWFIEPEAIQSEKIKWHPDFQNCRYQFRTYNVKKGKYSKEFTDSIPYGLLTQLICYAGESWNDAVSERKVSRTVNTAIDAMRLDQGR